MTILLENSPFDILVPVEQSHCCRISAQNIRCDLPPSRNLW